MGRAQRSRGGGKTPRPHIERPHIENCPSENPFPIFLVRLLPITRQKSPLARLALMEYDFRPHEAYDVAIAALFIVFMLIVIALVFVLH